jgi:hypothetical protein
VTWTWPSQVRTHAAVVCHGKQHIVVVAVGKAAAVAGDVTWSSHAGGAQQVAADTCALCLAVAVIRTLPMVRPMFHGTLTWTWSSRVSMHEPVVVQQYVVPNTCVVNMCGSNTTAMSGAGEAGSSVW